MNLHGIVSGAIGAVNPLVKAYFVRSIGSTTNADGTRVPAYGRPVSIMVQSQEVTFTDLKQQEGMNIQSVQKKIYAAGDWRGIIRAEGVGGDIMIMDGSVWLITNVSETWPDWCSFVATMQTA